MFPRPWDPARSTYFALIILLSASWGLADEPTAWTLESSGAAVAGSKGETSEEVSVVNRIPFTTAPSGWRAIWGVSAENTTFDGAQIAGTPDNLQSLAALVGVEFWQDGEVVATVRASPGEYFQGHPTAGDWDVPVEAWTGIPIHGTKSVSGAIGIETARFYHHPIPIVGAIWTLNPQWRLEALYPEPALVFTPKPDFSARIGGELIGAGYLARSLLGETPVEYYAYRVGTTARWKSGPWNFSAAAGDEVEREFDFFRQRRRINRGGRVYVELGISWSK